MKKIILPPADTRNWGSRKKASVVMAVRTAFISREQAIKQYDLSPEELASWELAFDLNGPTAMTAKAASRRRRHAP
jgi:hypothetical protein